MIAFKKPLYSAMVFFGTVTALTIGYSNYISSLPAIVGSGSGLTANEWNKMVTSLSDLDTNLSKLTFSGGNVGIGVSPDKKLTLRATTSVQDNFLKMYGWFNSYNNRYFQIFRGNAGTEFISSGDTGYNSFAIKIRNADSTDNQISLNTALFIDDNSNVGIGTVSPWTKLEVSGSWVNSVGIRITNSNASTTSAYSIGHIHQEGTNGDGIVDWPNAFVVEGLASGGLVLGSYTAPLKFQVGRVTKMSLLTNGNLTVAGTVIANGVTLTSDRNLKKNIETLTGGIDKILSIRGVTYNWKDITKGAGSQVGVIAQEVEQVLPELVNTDDKGMKSVNYAGLVAPLIEAVKELSHKMDELFIKYFDQQKEIDSLQQENKDIKSLLCTDHPTAEICK